MATPLDCFRFPQILVRDGVVRRLFLVFACNIGLLGCGSCEKSTPTSNAASDASSLADPSALPTGGQRLRKDDAGHWIPSGKPPEDDPARVPRQPASEPSFDLEPADPGADYVKRYVRATRRYGDDSACVKTASASRREGTAIVEVRGCSGGGAPLESFDVRVAEDRLSITGPPSKPLAQWPDGSDPGGPSGPPREEPDLREWKPPLREALASLQLLPIRVQYYARGTYPVVTLAGWRDPVGPRMPESALKGVAEKVCASTSGAPAGFFAGIDRSTILRVRCEPARARWEQL
jgi:hypothetical protein